MSEFKPVDHAGGQRHDVLQRPAQLDSDQIIIGMAENSALRRAPEWFSPGRGPGRPNRARLVFPD